MVGVVLARETIDNPWQDYRWRPLEVLIGVSDLEAGAIVKEGDGFVHYFAGTFPIELHRKDTPAYVVNLDRVTVSASGVQQCKESLDARGCAAEPNPNARCAGPAGGCKAGRYRREGPSSGLN